MTCKHWPDMSRVRVFRPTGALAVSVIGCGPIGLIAILAAGAQGATKVNYAAILSAPTARAAHSGQQESSSRVTVCWRGVSLTGDQRLLPSSLHQAGVLCESLEALSVPD